MGYKITGIILFGIVSLGACFLLLPSRAIKPPLEHPVPKKAVAPPTFSGEPETQNLQGQDFQEWINYFEEQNLRGGSMEAVVKEGETIVTEGYETTPGVFIFTSLTPSITYDNGIPFVDIKVKTFKGTVTGATPSLFTLTAHVNPKYGREVFFETDGMMHSISIGAEPDPLSRQVRLTVKSQIEDRQANKKTPLAD